MDENGHLTWHNETRRLSDLIAWEHNPRELTERQAAELTKSLRKFGLAQPLLISPAGDIYDGHQRDNVLRLMDEYGADADVDVRVSSRELTYDERRELVIRLHENVGQWDFDGLANLYDAEELGEWGFETWRLGNIGDEEWADGFAGLPDEDRAPFQQMTFTLHDSQVEQVKAALSAAKHMGGFATPNENSNGNALARICETFITEHGQS